MKQRVIDASWDYAEAETKEYTHCYHSYPAMMIPQVARRLINEFSSSKTKLVFDPYCGSGTTLVESKLAGIDSIGTDINPLASLIAKAKVQNFESHKVKETLDAFKKYIEGYSESTSLKIPHINNLDFWFDKQVTHKLAFLHYYIENSVDNSLKLFFLIPFSETVREASYTRNSEFKLYRIEEAKLKDFNVNPFELFLKKCLRNLAGLQTFNEAINGKKVNSEVFSFNTCDDIQNETIEPQSVDLVVTSPPYGDSHTTVAYGQFSTLSNEWLGISHARKVDNYLMGGTVKKNTEEIEISTAKDELHQIKSIDPKRYLEVNSFLSDYYKSIKNISQFVKKNGYVCYVVGNRTVKKVNIPLDYITIEFFSQFGFNAKDITVRRIPNKKMPSRNSPSNKVGDLVTTMNNEFIVVLKKTAS